MINVLIYCSEDGDIRVVPFQTSELMRVLEDHGITHRKAITDLKESGADPQYWGEQYLIVQGRIALPRAKQTITEYVLE